MIGWINYRLPGVFDSNPVHEVNISLWTVPFEFGCYALMALMIVSGALKHPLVILAIGTAIILSGLVMFATGHHGGVGVLDVALDTFLFNRGSSLFAPFTLGVAGFLLRYRIPYSRLLLLATVAGFLVLGLMFRRQFAYPLIGSVIDIPMVYLMMYIGVSDIPRLPFFYRGDYSYGIYLYGWPVMQTMRSLLPTLGANSWLLFLVSAPLITLFSVFSWHVIEKPILKLRKSFSFVARQRLAAEPPLAELAGTKHDRPLPVRS